ncbi:reverse transcriptase domain-containing protein [uncultured Thiohalocapsa sp.]|uniref:reverse transcriptase domain-containing protein n=1 Tax=uncultured Thiohalocapsa sp. TaxID=768990 RepID=UPI0025F26B76|nr:reverse transcriptase domain-containing protein [uncultured Thiohalocapsa sp.]
MNGRNGWWKPTSQSEIRGFFEHVSHAHLLRFLEHRIADPNLLRIIQRFLKAGIMEDGVFTAGVEETPQGGLVSPVLSNIYLHYVLDLWFEEHFARRCAGEAYLIRYADDYVACFEHEADARAFLEAMTERLAQFDLDVEPSKTALLAFGSTMLGRKRVEYEGPRTFSFLGFTHYVGRSRRGRFVVGRKNHGQRLRKKLTALNARLRALRTQGGNAMVAFLARHLRGHMQYYGVSGNSRWVASCIHVATGLLFKWLNRRSQKRSLTWAQFDAYLRRWLPTAQIVHDLYPVPWCKTQTGSRMV